jgi:hypothetical protein
MATSPAKRDDESEGKVIGPRVSQQFRSWLISQADNEDNRSNDVVDSQLDRMLGETDVDAIMSADDQGTHQARDLVGLEFEGPWDGFRVVKSSEKFDAPLGIYVQFQVTALSRMAGKGIEIGDSILISTGAPLVIGKLRTLEANGFLPMKLMIAGQEAPNGTVLKLRYPPNRAESA